MHSRKNSIANIVKPEFLFALMPFAHWLGPLVTGFYVFFIAILIVLYRGLDPSSIRFRPLAVFSTLFVVAYAAVSIARYEGDLSAIFASGSLEFPMLMLQASQFFIFIILVSLTPYLHNENIAKHVRYVWLILVLSIVGEAVATNWFGVPSELFFGYRDSPAYIAREGAFQRPFGLVGSAPINGSILVVLTWMLLGLRQFSLKAMIVIHITTSVTLIFNQSGQAVLTYLAGWILFFFRFSPQGLLHLFLGGGVMHIFLFYGEMIHYKLSYSYLIDSLQQARFWEALSILRVDDILFGAFTNARALDRLTIEFYPVHGISRFGILHFLAFWGTILFPLLFRGVNRYIRIALVCVLIGSLHYASVFIVFLQVPLAMVMLTCRSVRTASAKSFSEPPQEGRRQMSHHDSLNWSVKR